MPGTRDPSTKITVSDKEISYGIFHRNTKIEGELFPNGGPKASDVRQGYTDLDCYLLAPLASIAAKQPGKIKACFREYYHHNGKERSKHPDFKEVSNVTVRFFYFDQNGSKRRVEIKINKTALRGKGVPWVRLLEKAMLVYRAKGYDSSVDKSYLGTKKIKSRLLDGTKGGEASNMIAAITGEKTKSEVLGSKSSKKFPNQYSDNANDIYDRIWDHLKKGKVVTADAKYTSLFRIYHKGLFFNHVYSVIDAYPKDRNGKTYKFIKVRNPYANRIREYSQDKKGKFHSVVRIPKGMDEKGVSELELNNFLKNFESISYTQDRLSK